MFGHYTVTSYSSALLTLHRPTYHLLDARTPYLDDPELERRPCCCCIAGQCVISAADIPFCLLRLDI